MLPKSPGSISSIDPTILVNIVSNDTTALLSGLGGAVLGAFISAGFSWYLHRSTVNRDIAKEEKSKRTAEKTSALSALVRLQSASNLCLDLRNRVADSLTQAENDGYSDLATWQKITPITGLPPALPPFQTDELSLLFAAKRPDVANELIRFHSRIISMTDAIKTYNQLRSQIKEMMPAKMNGLVGITELTMDDFKRVAPFAAECQDLALQITEFLIEDSEMAISISGELALCLNSYFKDTSFSTTFDREKLRRSSILTDELQKAKKQSSLGFEIISGGWPPRLYPDISVT
ncbi:MULTISPECIES: hypothetical protein [Brucella/Ochrobactrum group]|jgi:glutaredoxin-related protein|uniref:hypothetical protein n=1 Tax=Brucella/Ochrobactrum group TaxID=2826938 RepID=UPI001296ECD8|nr:MULTISPECIES: hypothetical protein [Brucella/Ochrobactrum group]MBQ0708714.1 hypothetical protein [Ochrobactrum sp. AP1BH01-1]QGA56250.1 hypothetical protein GHC20_03760 [Brucella sp. 2280]